MSNQKFRILETIRQGQIGGGESHLLSLVENLDRSRFEPVVLSFTDGPMVDRLKQMGITTEVIYTEKPFDISKWKRVKQFIQQQQIQLVHAHGTRANSNVFWATRKLKLPLVYTIHGWSFHDDQQALLRKVRVMGEQLLTKKSDVNISVSASNQQTGKRYFNNFNSVVVNNGIDQRKFDPGRSFKNIRQELGIADNAVLVLFVARFIHQKQPLKLLEAFAKALPHHPQLQLLMVGDGDEKPAALQLVRELGIEDKVIFQPFRQDVPDVLAAADIFVLPSLWEGLPIGLLEAMAMGKAIIGTQVDGTSEVIRHEHNGLLISTDGLEVNLAAALGVLAEDVSLREKLGAAAQATISATYSAANMTREIEAIYLKLLGQNT
ncbi:glycosyltransferase family 4 protein [Pseudoflavitalea sp. G-6-1-2]|uniref:glycosyltransferase family 4 protein n=1 Tax=Pseudoflavitalea sp. G-6-1-2 TaxID=2728841 RepID=UPI00146F5F4A|nr:glycosyltransferase family 4 protein [Pseudoflavitalea sp. G-6-1-2]NML22821.1 glycosyltransferase family 4 protein [Pseudoflavitalea sp. G-6-1-2]